MVGDLIGENGGGFDKKKSKTHCIFNQKNREIT